MVTLRPLHVLAVLALSVAGSATAQTSGFVLVNSTGTAIEQLSIRRVGTKDWKALGSGPAAGGRAPIAFTDPDCAFDLQASVPGKGPVTWAGVNLCEVKSVVLRRDEQAGAWVDYDE